MARYNVKLIKIDRNGSKHYEALETCDRCNGRGWYATGVCNGELVPSRVDNAVCYKCHGETVVPTKWIERTPEYQAKLDARREAKNAAKRAAWEEEQKRAEAERKAAEEEQKRIEAELEAAEEARKAISKHVGEVGQRIKLELTYLGSAHFEVRFGWATQEMYIHNFVDENGNKFIWKSGCYVSGEKGEKTTVTGTIKEHSEYKGEKQTVLTRCKIVED